MNEVRRGPSAGYGTALKSSQVWRRSSVAKHDGCVPAQSDYCVCVAMQPVGAGLIGAAVAAAVSIFRAREPWGAMFSLGVLHLLHPGVNVLMSMSKCLMP